MRVRRIAGALRETAKYGPMKPQNEYGLSEEQINALGDKQKDVPGADPLGIRIGEAPNEKVIPVMLKCADEMEAAVSSDLGKRRICIDVDKVQEMIMNVKGSVMMAYPMGLPEWDCLRQGLEDNEDLAGREESKYVHEPTSCVMWFAGKKMARDQLMSKYVGKNEKCVVKVKLTPANGSAPQREPAVDAETQKKMMALWHKKQEEQKNLEENNEDVYLNSAWANPKSMKNQLHGIGGGGVRFR